MDSRSVLKMLHAQLATLMAAQHGKKTVIHMHPLDIAVLIREYDPEAPPDAILQIYEVQLIGCKVKPDCALKRGEPLAMYDDGS